LQINISDARLGDDGFVTDSSHVASMDPLAPRVEVATWKASAYEVDVRAVRAAEDARWARYEPFESYRPATGGRDAFAGPHIDFMRLKEFLRDGTVQDWFGFLRDLNSFADEYGLLGLFWDDYPSGPVLPFGKEFVAPEAQFYDKGKLRLIDPTTEGKELLLKLQYHMDKSRNTDGYLKGRRDSHQAAGTDPVALPSELVVFPRVYGNLPSDGSNYRPVPWDDAKEKYRALLVPDVRSYTGVSVLCRSEPLNLWQMCLRLFPSPSGEHTGHSTPDLSDEYAQVLANMKTQGAASPHWTVSKEGRWEQGWWCRNQLASLYLMVGLDRSAHVEYRRCPECGRPFPKRRKSKREYCPHPDDPQKPSPCGSRVTSQRHRARQHHNS
jgi:hypothetical protein